VDTSSDGAPSAPSSATATPQAFSWLDKTTAASRRSRSGMTCAPLTVNRGEAVLTWCLAAFPVRTSALRGGEPDSPASEADSGERWPASFARWDRATSSWRTQQCSIDGGSTAFSGTWPRWGSMRNGVCIQRKKPDLHTSGNGRGSWLPTPTAQHYGSTNNGQRGDGTTYKHTGKSSLFTMVRHGTWPRIPTPMAGQSSTPPIVDSASVAASRGATTAEIITQPARVSGRIPTPTVGDSQSSGSKNTASSKAHPGTSLTDFVRQDGGRGRVPTPAATDWKGSSKEGQRRGQLTDPAMGVVPAGGRLNPTWVEWLMGWPLGWTDCDVSATDRFREWCALHGVRSARHDVHNDDEVMTWAR